MVSLSFQVTARDGNTQLTLKKWAEASGLGTGPPLRLLAMRKSRCFGSTGRNHQEAASQRKLLPQRKMFKKVIIPCISAILRGMAFTF